MTNSLGPESSEVKDDYYAFLTLRMHTLTTIQRCKQSEGYYPSFSDEKIDIQIPVQWIQTYN
jgi:hypothetical protein